MPRGGGRGNKKSHKGQRRHFTSEDELQEQARRQNQEKEWRRRKGLPSEDEDEEEEEGAQASKTTSRGEPGELPPSDSESETDSDDDGEKKAKGVSHLIEVENPNHMVKKNKKISQLDGEISLSRREKEELEKQRAKEHYRKMHLAGKTDEARADLARLALIRKQREEAAKKREVEVKAKDAEKTKAEQKLLEKKAAQK